ncbi:MAG: efflux RND transporter periplasmic adaptor subunit [Candidatus Aminicenantes bacterium]|nr:MAG: efflux RND transporter periplasmic adaptor subunit [Candidatus Aminicenantes bacterium]
MKKKLFFSLIILIIIVGVVFSLTVLRRSANGGIQYRTAKVTRGDIEAIVVTTGTINPVTLVDVGSQVSGKIAKIYVDFNSRVKKGDILAEIDQSSFLTRIKQAEANYQSAKASLERARVTMETSKKKYERALKLFEQKLISPEEKETAETNYFNAVADYQSALARLEQAKSQLESSRVDLSYTVIKSPIDGVVIKRNINVGQTVAASFQAPVLFQIANDLTKMQVECSVDEADIGKIKEGQKVRFTVDAFPEESFEGVVSQVRYAPEVVQNVVTYTTIVSVENPEMKLRPGMTATVSIIVGEARNVLRVPNAALRFRPQLSPEEMKKMFEELRAQRRSTSGNSASSSGRRPLFSGERGASQGERSAKDKSRQGMAMVWVLEEGHKLRPVPVKTGVTGDEYTEIVRGDLKEGDEVVIGTGASPRSSSSRSATSSLRRSMFMIRR